jgi:hypothetical protein
MSNEAERMYSFASRDLDSGPAFVWTARVRGAGGGAGVYVRGQSFQVDGQASFAEEDPHPCAVEYLLGALGADLLCGFTSMAERRGVVVDAAEVSLSGRLDNPLVFLGSVGEEGDPGIAAISGTMHVATDATPELVDEIWSNVLARSPLFATLRRAAEVSIALNAVP